MNFCYSADEKLIETVKPANCFVIPKGNETKPIIGQSDLDLIRRLQNGEVIKGYGWDYETDRKDSGYLFSVHFDFDGKVSYELSEDPPMVTVENLEATFTFYNFEEKGN